MNNAHPTHVDLEAMAQQIMLAHGFEPDFPAPVQQQLADIRARPPLPVSSSNSAAGSNLRDLRHLLWSSIDNDTSRDLDQIEYAERLNDGQYRVLIGIADVDVYVPKGSAIDLHAMQQTTTVYTGVMNFSML